MPDADTQRFLIVRLSSLGDLVHSLPAFAALRSGFPAARIDWAVDEKFLPLIRLVPGVDEIIPLRRSVAGHLSFIRRLRRARYSCALDLQGLYRSALLAWCSGAPCRIGFDRSTAREPGASRFYTRRVVPDGPHIAEQNVSLAVAAGAAAPRELQFPLRVPEAAAAQAVELLARAGVRDFFVISPGGGWKSKRWSPDRYAALCRELWQRHGLRALVNAGREQHELAHGIVRAAAPAEPLVISPSLPVLAALLVKSLLVVGADSGPVHLAAALGTPVVALFGPTDPARNGPLPRGTVLRNVSTERTHKRGDSHSDAMLSLTVEQVVSAAESEIHTGAKRTPSTVSRPSVP